MEESLFNDCFDRAVLGAGAAVDTQISVDDVLAVALSDSLYGAVVNAGAAVDASIGNSISHDFPSNCNVNFHLNDVIHILTWIFQNATAFLKKV